tara:strand:+ start:105 stop:560 length:456 start_codon:yes stop_codon:yes gene_type:complete
MKKYVFLLLVFALSITSCSLDDDDSSDYYLEVLPIENVDIPEQFIHGEVYEITMTYTRPTSCYQFNDFIYQIDGQTRTVAIVNTVYTGDIANCIDENEEVTVSFDFMASGTETYLFKFFQGEDAQGVDQYYIIEVPVVEERHYGTGTTGRN